MVLRNVSFATPASTMKKVVSQHVTPVLKVNSLKILVPKNASIAVMVNTATAPD
jgi:hypothetical protein